jgi:hypothetical protein
MFEFLRSRNSSLDEERSATGEISPAEKERVMDRMKVLTNSPEAKGTIGPQDILRRATGRD